MDPDPALKYCVQEVLKKLDLPENATVTSFLGYLFEVSKFSSGINYLIKYRQIF